MCADGFANGVIGEIALTVEYEGRLVQLPEVVVFKNLTEPFLLGMEWIDAANIAVMAERHAGVVTLRDDLAREQSNASQAVGSSVSTKTCDSSSQTEQEWEEEEILSTPVDTHQEPVQAEVDEHAQSPLTTIEEEEETTVPTLLDGPPQLSNSAVIEHGSVNESTEDSGQGIRRTLAQFF